MIRLRDESFSKGEKPSQRPISGLLEYGVVPLDKLRGPTSHEASSFVQKILGARKTGHSGTLDADVSGVLPTLLGHACKVAGSLLRSDKSYVCVMNTNKPVSLKQVDAAFQNFRGKIYQTPPLASAVAKRLRVREVYSLKVLEVEGKRVLFDARVQHGTYIRKLCTDVGEVLGCGARMEELRRTSAGGFNEGECVTLQELSDFKWLADNGSEKELRRFLLPVEKVVGLKKVVVSDDALKSICSGANLAIPGVVALDEGIETDEDVQLVSGKGELVCLAKALKSGKEVRDRKYGTAFDVERVVHDFSGA